MKFNRETVSILRVDSSLVLIDSGTITDPVLFIDTVFPAEYIFFSFEGRFQVSTIDSISCALSFDGGVTFLNNADSYSVSTAGTIAAIQLSDAANPISPVGVHVKMRLFPGNAELLPTFLFSGLSFWSSLSYEHLGGSLNPDAIIPPIPTRATTIRVIPSGNNDFNPPTSGNTLTAGSWTWHGVPAPRS